MPTMLCYNGQLEFSQAIRRHRRIE